MSLKFTKFEQQKSARYAAYEPVVVDNENRPPPSVVSDTGRLASTESSVHHQLLFSKAEIGYSNTIELPEPIDDETFIKNLKIRFLNKKIYTCIESTVISINPYEPLPLYSTEVIAAYEHHDILTLPPHIYALCEFVLHCLKESNTDQCIICSGVSGSGKTENIKLALNYFINGSSNRTELNQVKTRFNAIPAILEAFGNSNTESNQNSTRLFYTLEIDFDFLGDPLGGQIDDYFIEKTRAAKHEIYGYNFHIFYQLIGGAGSNLLKFLKLKRNIEAYHLLKDRPSDQYSSNGQHHQSEFNKTKKNLQLLGFTANEIIECLQILAFILKLGNVKFLRHANIDSTEGCTIFNEFEINEICDIFKMDTKKFIRLLKTKIVKNQNELFITELSADSSTKIRNTVCRSLYYRLFTWIIEKINESIKTKPSLKLSRNNLSLFDSFGFENYYINFFEQLLINYLHEKLIQISVDVIFRQRQEDYLREDIGWTRISLPSNDLICQLIDRPRTGILAILNQESSKSIFFREEIFIKELNDNCNDNLNYIQINNPVQLDYNNNDNGYYLQSLPLRRRRLSTGDLSQSISHLCFGIRHFNENAVYSINGFIEKNTEHLGRNWSQFLFQTEHSLLKKLFPEGNPRKKYLRKPITLANQFLISIESIITKLQNKQLHYIMCIKPNRFKIPNIFDDDYVFRQLSSLFLIEQTKFLNISYFFNENYFKFFKRYRILSPNTWPFFKTSNNQSIINGVYTIIQYVFKNNEFSINEEFNFGKTKIFIKHLKTFIQLEEKRLSKLNEIAVIIQKNIRCWLQRKIYLKMIENQIKISRFFRNWKRRRFLLWLNENLPSNSPICREWPRAPREHRQTNELLRKSYHKWRCHRYRQGFDQINRNRMREKLTAMLLFKNKKESYKYSITHPFRGDYIRLRQNIKWKKLLLLNNLGDVFVVFADLVSKITKRCGKEQFIQKVIVITTKSFIILDSKTMQINYNFGLSSIFKISCSPFLDNILVIHLRTDQKTTAGTRAFIFESIHLIELITKLFLVIQNSIGTGPILEISPEFPVFTGKETLVLVFKNRPVTIGHPSSAVPSSSSASTSQMKISRKGNRLEFSN